jgi:dihydroorotase-like cyclic amidohydrolase
VCPHHISLTEDRVGAYDTNAKMNPPLRTASDVEALREAVSDGTIDLIATDHAPHHYDEKEREFADAPNGIIGLETALGVVVTNLVDSGTLDFATLVQRMSCSPARVFNLEGGTLRRGAEADITVFRSRDEVDARSLGDAEQRAEHAICGHDAFRARGMYNCWRQDRLPNWNSYGCTSIGRTIMR